jgi:uncharacterized protein
MISEAMQALYAGERERGESLLMPGQESVFEAAAFGRTARLAELLSERPELVGAWSEDGFTPLHLACFAGDADATRLLVERGADLEALSTASFAKVRPLGTAAFARDHESARVLLEAGADPNGPGEGGFTPLHTVAQNGDAELVRLLLVHGADPAATASDGRTPADLAPPGTWPEEPS